MKSYDVIFIAMNGFGWDEMVSFNSDGFSFIMWKVRMYSERKYRIKVDFKSKQS